MNENIMTIEQIDSAPIGTKIKSVNGKVEAIRVSDKKWDAKIGGMKTTMSHSRIVPVLHTKTLSGKTINHINHVGYVKA